MFNIIGITKINDICKIRFVNDFALYQKRFKKQNATMIDLIILPESMNKINALKYLKNHENFQSDNDQTLINNLLQTKQNLIDRKIRTEKRIIRNSTTLNDILSILNQ